VFEITLERNCLGRTFEASSYVRLVLYNDEIHTSETAVYVHTRARVSVVINLEVIHWFMSMILYWHSGLWHH
jgi:hypothetical protein